MILVDTSVWIDYFNGINNAQTDMLDFHLERDIIVTGDLILIELLQGFKSQKDFNKANELLNRLVYYDMVGKDIAYTSIRNYKKLRKMVITVRKTIDVIIAAFCIKNNFSLLHNDKDFNSMEKILHLKTIN